MFEPSGTQVPVSDRRRRLVGDHKHRTSIGRAVLAALFAILIPVASASAQDTPINGQIVPGRYVVTFQPSGASAASVARTLSQAFGFNVRHVYANAVRGMNIEIPARASVLPIVDALARNPNVESIGNDRYAAAIDTETLGVQRIFAKPNTGDPNFGTGVRVAVVDTGLDYNHSDLAQNIDRGNSVACTEGTDSAPLVLGSCQGGGSLGQDDEGHGTMVGGIIAAGNNGSGIVGVAPDAQLISVKVLDSTGYGTLGDIIAGLDHIRSLSGPQFVHLVNMSLAATCSVCVENSTDAAVFAFQQAVESVVANGTTVVVAASNDSLDASTSVPAAFDAAITVSAMADTDGKPGGNGPSLLFIGLGRQADDTFAKFSNYGADIDVTAPGVAVTSLNLGGGQTSGSGTSFASPYAAGVAALFVKSWMTAHSGAAPEPATVRSAMIQTGECADQSFYSSANGCPTVWPGDRDSIGEPLVRADRVAGYLPPAPVHDVAVAAVNAPGSTLRTSTATVSVEVVNLGDATETFSVSLADQTESSAVGPTTSVSVTVAPADVRTVDFSWTPTSGGEHSLVASATTVPGETNTADNTDTATAWVASFAHDVAVVSIAGDASVTQGQAAGIQVEVQNQGTSAENVALHLIDTSDNDAQIDSADILGLTAGTTTTVTLSWLTDTNTATGAHSLRANADITTQNVVDADPGDNNSDPFAVNVSAFVAATTMHVASLTPSSSNDGRTWTATASITVEDDNGAPVSAAAVNGSWSSGGSGNASCTTGGTGTCSVSLAGLPKKTGSVGFAITGVTASGLTYDAQDPDNVAGVTVSKP